MTRRSTPQKKADEVAFPVRVLLHSLEGGFSQSLGSGRDPIIWLGEVIGFGNAALYGWTSPYCRDGLALYCRSVADAALFLEAFPEFELADGTVSPAYNSPYVIAGRRRDET